MKKKKNPEDLMEEDLMETIQHRINELHAELKLLNARHGPLFVRSLTGGKLMRDLERDLEREQERLRREQERRGREEKERREHEAREHFSNGGTILERLETGITTLDARVSDMAVRQSTTNAKLDKTDDAKLDEIIAAVNLMVGRQNTAAGGLGSEVRPENALVEQQRLRREERERTKVQARAAEEQARREREAQENFLEQKEKQDIMKEFTTPRQFFQGGPLLPGVSTLVDNMLAISPTDPYDHSHQIIHDAYQSVLQKDKEGPMKINSDGDRDDVLKWGDGSIHDRVLDD